MLLPRFCALQGLLCLPLLACSADKDDDTITTTSDASTSATSGIASDETGPVTTSDAETSATATTANSTSATTGDDTTGTTGGDTTGAVGTSGDGTSGDGTTGDGTTGDGTTTGEPAGLSWAMDVYPVIVAPSCACHENGAGGMTMTNPTDSYESLVNVMSWQTGLKRVVPGDPDKSYLLHKVSGTYESVGGSGFMMPLGMPMPQEQRDLIEQWIAEGALP